MRTRLAAVLVTLMPVSVNAADLRLLMFEQPGCIYCARWTEDVGTEYPLTDEGKAAPLWRLQLRDPLPEGLTLSAPPVFTPTFVLVADGNETGRIEGYIGEDYFWPLLAEMIAKTALEAREVP